MTTTNGPKRIRKTPIRLTPAEIRRRQQEADRIARRVMIYRLMRELEDVLSVA